MIERLYFLLFKARTLDNLLFAISVNVSTKASDLSFFVISVVQIFHHNQNNWSEM